MTCKGRIRRAGRNVGASFGSRAKLVADVGAKINDV